MGTISFSIDEDTKKELERVAKQKGYSGINEYVLETIKKEMELEKISVPDLKDDDFFKEYGIELQLTEFSDKLSEMKNPEEKIKLMAKFDTFLKENKEKIREKCPNLLVSVLNSL